MKRIFIFLLVWIFSCNLFAQSYKSNKNEMENIKENDDYFWGYGESNTTDTATYLALAAMRQKIAKSIDSRYAFMTIPWDKIINTYESLCNEQYPVNSLIISDEPDSKMFCYISKNDLKIIFDEREEDINRYLAQAIIDEQNYSIGDALRLYYWSLVLCKSHPRGKDLKFFDESSMDSVIINDYIENHIRKMSDNIRVSASLDTTAAKGNMVILKFVYYGESGDHLINNLRYEYNDGRGYRGPIRLNCDKAIAEISNTEMDKMNIRIGTKCYEGKEEANNQMIDVLDVMRPSVARAFDFNYEIDLKKIAKKNPKKSKKDDVTPVSNDKTIEAERVIDTLCISDESEYRKIMAVVEKSIRDKKYDIVKPYFTQDAYNEFFIRLIKYGSATIIGTPQYKFYKFNNEIICRSIPMQFKFRNQTIINNVVFRFDPDTQKITSLSFRLTDKAESDILGNEKWNHRSRLTLINFMEDYQTAYALKRLDYMDKIFSEDALIIVGHVLKPTKNVENIIYKDPNNVQLIKMDKEEYMNRLRNNFNNKEYINIRFSNTDFTVAAGANAEIYGVQVKQEYFSNSYGDVGYLFLLVDLRNELPIIHVRAWQPDKTDYEKLINIHSFSF